MPSSNSFCSSSGPCSLLLGLLAGTAAIGFVAWLTAVVFSIVVGFLGLPVWTFGVPGV